MRGSTTVEIDDAVVSRPFCASFSAAATVAEGAREIRLAVTVYNTIAPFLDETTPTPTSWTFPSQLVSEILGPVIARWQACQ